MIRFGRFARRDCQRYGVGRLSTFDFLVNDNWEMLMKYREAARRLAFRRMRRRSQAGCKLNWDSYQQYLERHPLPNPVRLQDLISLANGAC